MKENEMTQQPYLIIVIGASGEWALTQIIPSLYKNITNGLMSPECMILGISRKIDTPEGESTTRQAFQEIVRANLPKGNDENVDAFLRQTYFYSASAGEPSAWEDIKGFIRREMNAPENILVVISTPTSLVQPTLLAIQESQIIDTSHSRSKLAAAILEKPYGRTEGECREVFSVAKNTFESGVYAGDHYLVKPTILKLGELRRECPFFSSSYNSNSIESVVIVANESCTPEHRHQTYQAMGLGAVSDMITGHLLPLAVWLAMPEKVLADSVKREYVELTQLMLVKDMKFEPLCFGQYGQGIIGGEEVKAYADLGGEDYLSTPTFFAGKVIFDEGPLKGVPIFLMTGKGLAGKHTEVRINYKPLPRAKSNEQACARFIIHEETPTSAHKDLILFQHNMRNNTPGYESYQTSYPIGSDRNGAGSGFHAYEKLLYSATTGHWQDFPFPEALIAMYKAQDELIANYRKRIGKDLLRKPEDRKLLKIYPAGSSGPVVPGFPVI